MGLVLAPVPVLAPEVVLEPEPKAVLQPEPAGRGESTKKKGAPHQCARALQAGKVNARALKAKEHGSPKTTGWVRHSPLRAARRVGAEREDCRCPGALAGPRAR